MFSVCGGMDLLADDQSFHGSLVPDLGLDNPGLDLPSDLQDIIFKEDGPMCISDDVTSHGGFDNTAYTPATNGSCSHTLSVQGHGLMQGHGHLGDPQDHVHINGLPDQLNQQLQQQQQQQQQLQQQYHNHHHQLHHHHLNRSDSCEHEGHQHHHHQHHHHQQQQQQHPLHQHQNHPHQQTNSYCSISGQPRFLYEGYDQSHLNHTSLPDSPPDSGSEPYSPPDGNLHQAMTDFKSALPGSLPALSQAMYLNHTSRLLGMPPNKAPPAYLGEPPKLNLHHQGSLQQQQEQQSQQQGQRLPVPYSTAVPMGQHLSSHQISPPLSHPILPAQMGSMNNIASQASKKMKFSESPTGTLNSSMMHGMNGVLSIKQEPPGAQFSRYIGECSVGDDDLSPYDLDSNGGFIDGTCQVIKWLPFSQSQWVVLTDGDLKDLPTPYYRVDADKGFNFSVPDEAFVCQKKNHFQVTVHMRLHGNAKYIRTVEGVKKMEHYYLHFYGIKMESQNQHIKIEQSQSDRSKKSFHPVKVDLAADQETKVTVGRLHFSETTSNNMRKKGKPNPDQRYFLLVVSLHAHCGDKDYMLVGSVSDRIIVRASNPGQFDSDVDVMWQKGQTQESVYHMGKVGINTDHPEESLTVIGNMRLTGHLTQPSDMRAKEAIQEIDPKGQLENVSKLRIYKYKYREEYAAHAGISPDNREDTGVLAQEILDVLPDAVQVTGDVVLSSGETIENFLVVNKDRIFMENVGAVKELCKLTDNLEVRIDQLEKMNKKLGKLKRFDSLKSTTSSVSAKSISTVSCSSSVAPKNFSSNSSHGTGGSTYRGSHHNTSRCGSHMKSLNSSRSTLSSFVLWPFKNKCASWFKYLIIGLIVLMLLCLAALACLYILEVQKPDTENPLVSAVGSEPEMSTETTPPSVTNEESVPTVSTRAKSTETVTLSSSTVRGSTGSSTAVTTNTAAATPPTSPNQPVYPPVVPPYPPCTEGYCEKLCCPPPHEDGTDEDSHDSYNFPSNGDGGENQGNEDWQTVTKNVLPTKSNRVDTIIVDLPDNSSGTRNPDYHIENNIANSPVRYSVINHDGRKGLYSVYSLRRRRGADDAPRPTVKISELNYFLTDVYCETCQGHNYTYYVPYNASFGYEQITLELSTPTMSYMALCSSSFMWTCPPPSEEETEVGGPQFQQTSNARWTVKLGTHFRTILTFRVIHSLKGKPVVNACSIQNNDDFVVMSYTIRFQRQC